LRQDTEVGCRIVPSTVKAFGFQKELALQIRAVRIAPRNDFGYTHYASGTFLIRSTLVLAPKWLWLIPNANVIARESMAA
jgi:hypothetical protein